MAKRSDKERVPKDKYRTPAEAVAPLLPHLRPGTRFIEPCAGDGRLARHLEVAGHRCLAMYDTDPDDPAVKHADAIALRWPNPKDAIWITNPPWRRDWMHPIILNLCCQAPLWALFDADWPYTQQAIPLLPYLHKIVAVGRVEWFEGSGMSSKDNVAWFNFDQPRYPPDIRFFGKE